MNLGQKASFEAKVKIQGLESSAIQWEKVVGDQRVGNIVPSTV